MHYRLGMEAGCCAAGWAIRGQAGSWRAVANGSREVQSRATIATECNEPHGAGLSCPRLSRDSASRAMRCLCAGVALVAAGSLHCMNAFGAEEDRWGGPMGTEERLSNLEHARQMFTFGYDNYMRHAFPLDELNPHLCTGRGVDYGDATNININDALGNFSLTLIDSLDTLAVMGNRTEFARAVGLVIKHVSFDQNSTVQVFEVSIRVLGGLLSAHCIAVAPEFGMHPPGYGGELLHMAEDLGRRLLPAFQNTKTGIPHPRVHLQNGLDIPGFPATLTNETCSYCYPQTT